MNSFEFMIGDEKIDVELNHDGDSSTAKIGEEEFQVKHLSDGRFVVYKDGKRISVAVVKTKDYTLVELNSITYEVREVSTGSVNGVSEEETGAKDKIFAPMPGKIVKLLVEVGQTVEPKQQAVIVEAMKMENPVLTQAKGVVKVINFAVGDQVDTDTPIIELEIDEE